jgi:hopanoid biosynthesis associated RND transporter like protein HpnN
MSESSPASFLESFLVHWSRWVLRFPVTLVIFFILLAGYSFYYTVNNLGVNTNTSDMLAQDLPFQINRKRLEQAFPEDKAAIIFVVEAKTPEETSIAANYLRQKLEQDDHFLSAYIPTDNPFFRQQALLYLDIDELEDLATKLTDAQPFIGYLSEHYSLDGLFTIISKALEKQNSGDLPMDLEPLLTSINQTVKAQLNGTPQRMSWQTLLAATRLNTDNNRTLVIARPKMNFNEIMPAEAAFLTARSLVKSIIAENPSVKIRITGETALEHEELESVTRGAEIAGIVSLILVCTSLLVGLRSFKLLLATFITLILGLILTAGFATLAIGHLNLISIAFAVLYIGLGVDYAIHICLHYRELKAQNVANNEAIIKTIKTIGVSIFLCALTTSIGFFAFIPTDFVGVSELGIISGVGMFIGLVISLTLLPALLKIMPVNNIKPFNQHWAPRFLVELPYRQAPRIKIYSFVFALASAAILTQLVFDSNPINLRDPESESVSTIKELLKSRDDSPFALSVLVPDLENATALAEKLKQLPSVHETIILSDLVAENQDEKLALIEDLAMILGSQLDRFDQPLQNTQPLAAIKKFIASIDSQLQEQPDSPYRNQLLTLKQNLNALIASDDAKQNAAQLEQNILDLLPYTMQRLKTSLQAYPYSIEDLPDYLTQHWRSKNGMYRVMILPEHDLNNPRNLKQFVAEVTAVAPTASGLPVADQASGEAVVNAFIEAFSSALIAIFVLLLLIFRNLKHTLLIIGPLLLAGLLTGAANVLLHNNFNFANIIALPLLLGMGVDSGIHILQRLKSGHANILESSSARGVFFSSLTTLCSFSSLAFTPHQGTASMGILLAIGITFTLLCTLIVLPAFYGKPRVN